MNTIHFDKFFDVLIISFSGEIRFVIFRGEAGRDAGRWGWGALIERYELPIINLCAEKA
jgi:hypothetical protein